MAKSEYLQREEAAKKQLGTKGVKNRVKQLPTAARASLREMTGVDISRKGVSVDPLGVAMALPLGKVLKAAKALRAAGQIGKASSLEARIAMKDIGREIGKAPKRGSTPFDARYVERGTKGTRFENMDNLTSFEKKYGLSGENRVSREIKKSSSVYPKISSKERSGIKPKTSPFVEAYGKRKLKAEAKRAKRGRASSLLAEYLPGLYD